MKIKVFPNAFKYNELASKLSGLTAMAGYSFTKRNNLIELNRTLELLPPGYVAKQKDYIELTDIIFSGSSDSPFLLTIIVGRNDRFQGTEHFDIDVFNVAPNTGTTASYIETQWHHYMDDTGKRTSYQIAPLIITDEEKRKDITYATFLTGSTSYYSLSDYEKEKDVFFNIHIQSFGNLPI